jgi:hypothetical protein
MTKQDKLRIRVKREPRQLPALPLEVRWNEHLEAMVRGSQELLAALKREHPHIIEHLLRRQREKKGQRK